MPDHRSTSRPPRPPHPGDLVRLIRRLAAEGKVAFSRHVLDERLDERGFDVADVFELLRSGDIDGPIRAGRNSGEWRCLVVGRLVWSPREAGVATVVVREERLIIATVEWMDP